MATLLRHLAQVVTCTAPGPALLRGQAMADAGVITDGWLRWEDARITGTGPMATCPTPSPNDTVIDAPGCVALPGFVDSHTHLVFAHDRVDDMVRRLRGEGYAEIAAAGGGIVNSALRLRQTPPELLLEGAVARAREVVATGTTTLEIKSGYGLDLASELTMLRVARELARHVPITIQTTLLAAHALPPEYRHDRAGYLRLIAERILPQAADEGLADYVDVFCEGGFFTEDETVQLLEVGARHGLRGRVHANELGVTGGVEAAVRAGAMSADHLECTGPEQWALLAGSAVVPTVLPATAFFLRIEQAPARAMIDAGLGIALASDYNPGTCPSGNMPLVVAMACAQLGLQPAEAVVAATRHGAAALGLSDSHGRLDPGYRADVVLTEPIGRYEALAYWFGRNVVRRVWVGGQAVMG